MNDQELEIKLLAIEDVFDDERQLEDKVLELEKTITQNAARNTHN